MSETYTIRQVHSAPTGGNLNDDFRSAQDLHDRTRVWIEHIERSRVLAEYDRAASQTTTPIIITRDSDGRVVGPSMFE